MDNNVKNNIPVKAIPSETRIENLNKLFSKEFSTKPTFFVRVPGRVNIIGEHIDYCGYPVLPMALEQDILIAAKSIDILQLQIHNVDEKYASYKQNLTTFTDINITPNADGRPHWYNYVLCGVKGAMEFINDKITSGVQIYIDGNIPPASGLSSSSALVSAACLSFLHANNVTINKTDIASLCARCERYIGTQGGGMDQAIAFLAEKYSAQYITWNPLKATPVTLPKDAVFVVAHSRAEANKAATNDFNRRVIECRLAAKMLAAQLNAECDKKIITLGETQIILDKTLDDMVCLVHKYLPKEIYTKNEICDVLKVNSVELEELYLTQNTKHIAEFKLKQRALHVYEEAIRVETFRNICTKIASKQNGYSNGISLEESKENDVLNTLGELMTQSHESLKCLYECSHENLDRIVEISKKMNVHCRLTGAGWGGCVVSLCPKNDVDFYIKTIKDEFYSKLCNINENMASNYIFATTPNHGAVIYV